MANNEIDPVSLDEAIAAIEADARECADDAYKNNGWRKAPAQSVIVAGLINGRSNKEVLAILRTWNQSFHKRLIELSDADWKLTEAELE